MKYKLTLLTTTTIAIASLIPIPEVPNLQDVPFYDKWVHFVMYGTLTASMYIDRKLAHKDTDTPFIITAFIMPSLFGGLMELAQAYCTTCRSGEWLDFYADTFGALLSTFISLVLWKIVKTSVLK